MCIACRTPRDKRELVRIVRSPQGEISFDPTGKRSGRGAYLCPDEACFDRALHSRTLAAALKSDVSEQDVASLRAELRALLSERGMDDAAR